ncbi:hypothetical protein COB72_01795 [bacterium]|nr:MAG: hypothetical protein COB72_01795 [bacterium]
MMTEPFSTQQHGNQQDIRPLSAMAVTSLVLGILFLCTGPLAIIPLVLGIIAIVATSGHDKKRGLGLAIAGTSLGALGLFVGTFLMLGIMLPALGAARTKAQEIVSQTNIRTIAQGAVVYADGHGDMFPTTDQWSVVLIDAGLIQSHLLESPAEDGDGISYIYLGGESTRDAMQILIYEDPKHFFEGVLVGFADGHVEMIDHETFEQMLADQLAAQEVP